MTVCLLGGFFFFSDTAPTEIYTLSLHDALPISRSLCAGLHRRHVQLGASRRLDLRSEEHTSDLQSHSDLVCRLLLEKKQSRARKAILIECTHLTYAFMTNHQNT